MLGKNKLFKNKFSWLAVLIFIFSLSSLGQGSTPTQNWKGVLSMDEGLPEAYRDLQRSLQEDPLGRRVLPFVEVISPDRLQECKKNGWDNTKCSNYEWSVPFITESAAKQMEEDFYHAWTRFAARTYWRVQAATNAPFLDPLSAATTALSTPHNTPMLCLAGVRPLNSVMSLVLAGLPVIGLATDPFYDWNLKGSEFCDDLSYLLQCIPIDPPCWGDPMIARMVDMGCYGRRYQDAYKHALTKYYPPIPLGGNVVKNEGTYWGDIYKSVTKNMPMAIWWDGVQIPLNPTPGSKSGVTMSPVLKVGSDFMQTPAQWTQEAMRKEPRAALYYFQPITRFPVAPTDKFTGEPPGIASLEAVKPSTSTRYGGPMKASGKMGHSLTVEQEKYGHAVMFQTYGQQDALVLTPYVPTVMYDCRRVITRKPVIHPLQTFATGVLPIPTPINYPLIARAYYEWNSVAEGYEIPLLKGNPDLGKQFLNSIIGLTQGQ